MYVEALGLKTREAVGYLQELFAGRLQMAEAFFKTEVRQVVRASFIAQNVEDFSYCLMNAFFQYARKM